MPDSTHIKWHTGETLKRLCKSGRLNAEAVSTAMGVSSATLYRWYRQPALPPQALATAAQHFGVSAEWLAHGRGAQHSSARGAAVSAERRVERLLLLYEADMKRLTRAYTAEVAKALAT